MCRYVYLEMGLTWEIRSQGWDDSDEMKQMKDQMKLHHMFDECNIDKLRLSGE